MKTKHTIACLIVAIVSFTGCTKDFEEINTSPNKPSEVLSHGVFNYTNKYLMDKTRGVFSSGRMTLGWIQYTAQRNYNEEDLFRFREVTNNELYRDLYISAQNYKKIIDLNTNPESIPEMKKHGNLTNQIAAARIMLSYTFSLAVDLYGDVPYYSYGTNDPDFQALKLEEGILKPKFASQVKIYTDILKELKEAAEMIDEGAVIFNSGDHLFGNSGKLKRFANSLRLRIANRVKGSIARANTDITEAIASGVMVSDEDTVGLTYEKNNVNPAPFYTGFFIDNRTDFAISNSLVDLLKSTNYPNIAAGPDPRLQRYATPTGTKRDLIPTGNYEDTDDLSKYLGMPYGIPSTMSASQRGIASLLGFSVLRPDYTEIIMEYAEVAFLLSEINGWDQTHYENGVRSSLKRWGVVDTRITSFMTTLKTASEETVLTQKYIALFMQPLEAWAEYRRTGFPHHLIVPGEKRDLITPYKYKDDNNNEVSITTYTFTPLITLTRMPSRITYPVSLQTLNPDNYQAASQNIGGDQLNTKLIWANY